MGFFYVFFSRYNIYTPTHTLLLHIKYDNLNSDVLAPAVICFHPEQMEFIIKC